MKNIIIGLICVMAANILLGATLSKFKDNFNWNTLFKGVFKCVCVVLGIGLVYLCGYLNPTILAVQIEGIDMNLMEAIKILFTGGIMYYGYQDIVKIKDILTLNVDIQELELQTTFNNDGIEDLVEEGEVENVQY